MTTYQLLKQLNNKRGGVHSDLRRKADAPASESAVADDPAPLPKPGRPSSLTRLFVFAVATAFLGCFWLIFQLVTTSQLHEVRFQRLITILDKQETALKAIDQKITTVSAELPKINEDIAVLSNKASAAILESAKLGDIVAGQVEVIEDLKRQTVSVIAQPVVQ